MKVETPLGDVIDKITILRIKRLKLQTKEAVLNVEKELNALTLAWKTEGLPEFYTLAAMEPLALVNANLWQIEDELRDHEKRSDFGEAFVQKARKVYQLNDKRSLLKRKINVELGSLLQEEKSHF